MTSSGPIDLFELRDGILRNLKSKPEIETCIKSGLEKKSGPSSTLEPTLKEPRNCPHNTQTLFIKKTDFKTGLVKNKVLKALRVNL